MTVQVIVTLIFVIILIIPIYLQMEAEAPVEKKESKEAMVIWICTELSETIHQA